jgi:hypothetical protein
MARGLLQSREGSLVGRPSGPRMAHRIRGQVARTLLVSGYRLGRGGTVPPGAVARPLRRHTGTAGHASLGPHGLPSAAAGHG